MSVEASTQSSAARQNFDTCVEGASGKWSARSMNNSIGSNSRLFQVVTNSGSGPTFGHSNAHSREWKGQGQKFPPL